MSNRLNRFSIVLLLVSFLVTLSLPARILRAQSGNSVECGDIVEGVFTEDAEEHRYLITMHPRESFEVAVESVGDDLQTALGIYGPTGKRIALSGKQYGFFMTVTKTHQLSSGVVGSDGDYVIRITNTAIQTAGAENITTDKIDPNRDSYFGGIGAYELRITCIGSDGEIVGSDTPPVTENSLLIQTTSQGPVAESTFSFLTTGNSYEITFGSQTKIVKLIELTGAGWAKIEVNGTTGWLNLHQVALIIPLN